MTTATADVRFTQHVKKALSSTGRMPIFHRAIKKYGANAMSVSTLLIAGRAYCAMMEEKIIAAYGAMYPRGYNLVKGGEGSGTMTLASRRRKSESLKKTFALPEIKQKLSAVQKTLWAKPDERKKRADAIKAAFADESVRVRLIEAQKAGNADPAVKARRAEIMRQRMADPETKKRIIERMLRARGIFREIS